MNRKKLTIILCCIGAVALASVIGWQVYRIYYPEELENVNTHPTDAGLFFDQSTPPADTLIVGKWSNKDNPKWFKVYYDDYDEEQCLYWGKEWDENEDIFEEDLKYHGNGWFRWKKEDGMLHEFATMDYRDVPIHRGYKIVKSTEDSLSYFEAERKSAILRFGKVND